MRSKLIIIFASLLILGSCRNREEYIPKPKGYFRIALPSQEYKPIGIDCPFSFEMNTKAKWAPHKRDKCWGDVYYPDIKAILQLTYKKVTENNLDTLLEDGRELVYKHVVKADGIRENLIQAPEDRVHGIYYEISGDAASSAQFFVTDSANHYLRGVLYFFAEPNADSIEPVNNYMGEEILHLIETLQWQNL